MATVDLLFEILGCLLEGLLGSTECFHRVAKHALGRLLDTLVQPIDALPCHVLGFFCFPCKAGIQQLTSSLQRFFQSVMLRVSKRIVELSGEQWFSRLGPFDRVTHPFQQCLKILLLPFYRLANLFTGPGISQATRFLVVQFPEFLGNILLLLLQLLSELAQLLDFLFKLVGCPLPEIIPHLLQLSLGSHSAGRCLG